jgi:hypothetical protein
MDTRRDGVDAGSSEGYVPVVGCNGTSEAAKSRLRGSRLAGSPAAYEIIQQRHAQLRQPKLPDDLVWRSSGTMDTG